MMPPTDDATRKSVCPHCGSTGTGHLLRKERGKPLGLPAPLPGSVPPDHE